MPVHPTVFKIAPSPDSILAVEVRQLGWSKKKHLFVFERYSGEFVYDPEQPLASRIELSIEADSVICRDSAKGQRQRDRLTDFARQEALAAHRFPRIQIQSERFVAKALRGFVAEGTLSFHEASRPIRANFDFGVLKRDRLQIDSDATLRLSEYNLPRPSSLLGMIRTDDEVVLHALVWGTIADSDVSL